MDPEEYLALPTASDSSLSSLSASLPSLPDVSESTTSSSRSFIDADVRRSACHTDCPVAVLILRDARDTHGHATKHREV